MKSFLPILLVIALFSTTHIYAQADSIKINAEQQKLNLDKKDVGRMDRKLNKKERKMKRQERKLNNTKSSAGLFFIWPSVKKDSDRYLS